MPHAAEAEIATYGVTDSEDRPPSITLLGKFPIDSAGKKRPYSRFETDNSTKQDPTLWNRESPPHYPIVFIKETIKTHIKTI